MQPERASLRAALEIGYRVFGDCACTAAAREASSHSVSVVHSDFVTNG